MLSGIVSGDVQLTTSTFRLSDVTRPRLAFTIVVSLILPIAICWIRGICWESLVGSLVAFALGTVVLRAPIALWLATMAVVVTIGTVGLLGWSALNFHSVNVFSSTYSRISYCGRDFEAEGPVASHIRTDGDAPIRVVGVTPSGSAILGSGSCLSSLWVKSPGPRFQSFDLEGGP
jgi:hypothetical protein